MGEFYGRTAIEYLDDTAWKEESALDDARGEVLLDQLRTAIDKDVGEGSGSSGSAAPVATPAGSASSAPATPSTTGDTKASSTHTAILDLSEVTARTSSRSKTRHGSEGRSVSRAHQNSMRYMASRNSVRSVVRAR